MSSIAEMKGISEQDRKQIRQATEMLGPDPESMGFVKNLFWGHFMESMVFPHPEISPEETERCDELIKGLDAYLVNEHPAFEIDQKQEIPEWARERLFKTGVLGMIIPREYAGGGFGITSYNRALERIGRVCGSSAVLASAHQSIGCGAITFFGTEDQKRRFLHRVANDTLSAFCLSEPNVGCDAGGQETRCELSEDGTHYILNGEKKWATSAAIGGIFTVAAKQLYKHPKTGEMKEGVTCLICTPDMEGVEIYSRNRSKCGIRGTWQARIRFNNVKVPVANRLHKEGRGLNVALHCLNYGRCTLAAGMVGAAKAAYEQALKWAAYRYQFERPIGDFELVQHKLAEMAALTYAIDAVLYMTTQMIDRGDKDIMLETAICKVFCSEMGFRSVNHAMQVLGGESYMTENRVERLWRDSRINLIVEGANEVMHSFVFAYGSKQLGEWMLGVQGAPLKNFKAAAQIGAELFLGVKRPAPRVTRLHPKLDSLARDLEQRVQEFSHQVRLMFKEHREKLVTNQMIQYRLSMTAMWLYAMVSSLAKVDRSLRNSKDEHAVDDEVTIVRHLCAMGGEEIDNCLRALRKNTDETMRACAAVARHYEKTLPNSSYVIPEKTPDKEAFGTGIVPDQTHIPQFGSGSTLPPEMIPR
ncbi:MAG: acyl-CoA dehydrogenase family protein [Planctomycetota bacterium]